MAVLRRSPVADRNRLLVTQSSHSESVDEIRGKPTLRTCFREPIAEIFDAARYLDAAVTAHLSGDLELAKTLFASADIEAVWNWTDSVWGANSQYVTVRQSHARVEALREKERMPSAKQKAQLHQRDGFHCRFCGLPVVRPEVRKKICSSYPDQVPWGRTNKSQHAALQAMWAQYDHVVPHAHGGKNDLENLVVTCAACNFGKMSYTLEELSLSDPRLRPPVQSPWDGLERFK